MDVIEDLLRIKLFREERAEIDLLKRKNELSIRENELLKARSMLEEFRKYSARKEAELYADLCSRLVVQKDLDNVSIEIQLMKEQIEKLVEDINQAKERRSQAIVVVDEAKLVHQEAVRMREKFMEIRRIQEDEKKVEITHFEDIEMEEVAEQRFSRINHLSDD